MGRKAAAVIVVDIGCYDHPRHEGVSQDSIGRLIDRFQPALLYGFDPYPATVERDEDREGTRVSVRRSAAWTWGGSIPYKVSSDQPLHSQVSGDSQLHAHCFDLAAYLQLLPFAEHRVVVKLDAEGAEYILLQRLIDMDVDESLALVLVEWHDDRPDDRERLTAGLRCPIEEWA